MSRPELGTKCTCAGCSERFYDLNRSPAICPKCGAQQPAEKPRALRPFRSAIEHRRLYRQPAPSLADDEVQPVSAPDAEDEEEADTEDEADGEVEIDPDHEKAPV